MKNTLKIIAAREEKVKELIDIYKKEIVDEIRKTSIPGVKEINAKCATISASNFIQMGIWAPEYFFRETQADLVEKTLISAKTASDCLAAIAKMVSSKKSCDGQRLNESTLEILQKYM